MKYDKKEPETMDADPMRLLVSAILAFTVMLFINGFVGSMGGFPAFVAFTLVFFRIRTRAGMENGGMQQELSDRQITGRLLWKYAAGYLVLWGILRIAFLISRVTGWGNINGASAVEYVRQMWNTSLLEKWAYFFAGMIMFAFVLSLFPLAVIREKVRWIRYALVDGAVFALVCLGINGVCRLKFEQKSSGRATCLIDHLLLCGRMRTWQEITCLLAMVVFILVIGAFVFSYASRQYAVKNIDGIPASAGEEESRRHRMIRKIVTVGCSIAAAAIVVVIVLLMPKDTAGDYTKVAEFLTEDTRMGPMEYGDAVYVPVNEKADLEKNGIAQGYLAERGERCDSRFYQLAIANLLYTDPTGKTNLVQTAGTDGGTYAPVASVETDKAWETDDVFLLWDEDWALESAYSHEPTGYVACPADLIQGLRMQFPDVTYRTADFSDYDAYFTLRGYQNMEQALEKTGKDITTPAAADLQPVDKWILSKLNTLVKDVTDNMDHFELGIAVQKVYDFIWDEFCDWYIEMVKPRLYSTDDAVSQNAALWTLKTVLIDALKLLHPYMPFITEEIFCTIQNEEESIMISKWPEYSEDRAFPAEEKAIETIKEAVRGIRNIRTEMNVAPSRKASVYVVSENDEIRKIFEEGKLFFASLAYANEIMIQADKTGIADDAVSVVIPGATLYIPFAELVDIAQEIERLKKEQKRLEGELARSKGMLSNERFLSKAPEAKIAEEKEKLAKYEQMMEQVTKRLEQLA